MVEMLVDEWVVLKVAKRVDEKVGKMAVCSVVWSALWMVVV